MFPILESDVLFLPPRKEDPRNKGQEDRVALRATLNSPAVGTFHFVTTHLTFIDLEQCNSYLQLLRYLNSFSSDYPVILAGDFNAYFDFEWFDYYDPTFSSLVLILNKVLVCCYKGPLIYYSVVIYN